MAAVAAGLGGLHSTAAAQGNLPTVSIDYMGSATGIAYEHESIVFALTRTGDAGEALDVQVEVEESGDMVEAAGEGVQTVTVHLLPPASLLAFSEQNHCFSSGLRSMSAKPKLPPISRPLWRIFTYARMILSWRTIAF